MNLVDLHIHSNASHDGELSPGHIVKIAAQKGIKALAITDHNTIAGVKDAKIAGEQMGVEVLSGVEIDCSYKDVIVHVAGYMFDENNDVFNKIEEFMTNSEKEVSVKRVEILNSLGMPITPDEMFKVVPSGRFTGPFIAKQILTKPEAKDMPMLKKYFTDEAPNPYSDFYWDFIAPGKPAFVPMKYYSLKEVVEFIEGAGGIAVLAHPGAVISHCTHYIEGIAKAGVRGIEVYCSYHSPQEIEFYLGKASEFNLVPTLGSDFHGYVKPKIEIGNCFYEAGTGLDILDGLKNAINV